MSTLISFLVECVVNTLPQEVHVTFEVGDKVMVTQGSLKDNTAKVIDVNDAKKRLTIGVQFMGSERKV